MATESFVIPLIFAFCSSFLVGIKSALDHLGKDTSEAEMQHFPHYYRIYLWISNKVRDHKWRYLFQHIGQTKRIVRLFYAVSATLFLVVLMFGNLGLHANYETLYIHSIWLIVAWIAIAIFGMALDFLFRLLGAGAPISTLKLLTPFAWIILGIFYPIATLLLRLSTGALEKVEGRGEETRSEKISTILTRIISDTEIKDLLTISDQKLLHSIASFHDLLVKEIMVPRIDVCGIDSTSSIREAAKTFLDEGYSRVPVYKTTIDEILGVLLYKDLLRFYIEGKDPETPVSELISPVLFAPESKKISRLLQDFKAKKTHFAIIVDEYGGTEGIVTIEDILEELVGEIADEYDLDEERLYISLKEGGWIVDAKMSTLDIEKELGVIIPSAPEYDTIGGYIYHKAGSIPSKGWIIHHDNFDIEVTSSSDRAIDKVRITPST